MILSQVLPLFLAYLLGSVPFGFLLTRLTGAGDVRNIGSGNIGATNVLRTGRKGLAALTLLLDMLKGTAAVLLARSFAPEMPEMEAYAGLCALLGHLFPVWLKFKGGKGVATFLGALLALSWPAALFAMLTWLAVALLTRLSSLSALAAVGATPIFLTIFEKGPSLGIVLFMALLVYIRHADNISRLLAGEEPRIGEKK